MRRYLVPIVLAIIASTPSANAGTMKIVRSTAMAQRSSIDAVCDVFNARPTFVRHVRLTRVASSARIGSWRLIAGDLSDSSTAALEFADVYSRDGKIVYAIDTRADVAGAREYCFVNGKLARASSNVLDAATNVSKTRKLYYDTNGALFADTGLVVTDIEKRRNNLVPANASETVPIAVYATPRNLPFYEAYRSAIAGRLPTLR